MQSPELIAKPREAKRGGAGRKITPRMRLEGEGRWYQAAFIGRRLHGGDDRRVALVQPIEIANSHRALATGMFW